MIPIDNSIAGRVADIHHFLPTSDLHIVAEHFLRIQFTLMGVPGSSLDTIKTVHSHVHALGQCRKVIRELGLTPLVSGDTAGRPARSRRRRTPPRPRIAPPLAAEIYGLDILRDDVEDEEHNTTRFVVLAQEYVEAPAGAGPVVTTFVFNVRNLPAALYKALGGFATNGVNMTKLESYMVGGHFTATQFLAEVDGHPQDPRVARALEELAFFTTDVKVLGRLPRRRVPASGGRRTAGAARRAMQYPRPVTEERRTEDLGFARVDLDRAARTGDAEVVYGAGKTPDQVVAILRTLHAKHPDRAVLATRLERRRRSHAVGRAGRRRRPGRPGRHARPAPGLHRHGRGDQRRDLRRSRRRRGRAHRPRPRRRRPRGPRRRRGRAAPAARGARRARRRPTA